jgi:hypothetical protein
MVFHLEAQNDLLVQLATPSFALFQATMMMGLISIREGCFDNATETVLGTIGATVVLSEVFPNFNVLEMPDISLPPMFHELWDVHSRFDANLIPRTLSIFQNPAYTPVGNGDEMWAEFVRGMCRTGKRDFTSLLERSKPIALRRPSDSGDTFPQYEVVACG